MGTGHLENLLSNVLMGDGSRVPGKLQVLHRKAFQLNSDWRGIWE